jgi:hypothetical protein
VYLRYWYKSTNTDAAAAESLDLPFRASTLIQTLTLDDWMLLAAMEKEKVRNAAAKTAAEVNVQKKRGAADMAAADTDEQAKKRGAEAKSAAEAIATANAEIYKAMRQNVSNASNLSTLNTARQASVAGATERSPRDATERSPREAGATAISALPGKPLVRRILLLQQQPQKRTDPAAATAADGKEAGNAQAAAAKASAEPLLPEEVHAKGEALLRAAGRGGGGAYRRISPEYYLEGSLQNSAHDRFV